jgi:hypothetical protein
MNYLKKILSAEKSKRYNENSRMDVISICIYNFEIVTDMVCTKISMQVRVHYMYSFGTNEGGSVCVAGKTELARCFVFV